MIVSAKPYRRISHPQVENVDTEEREVSLGPISPYAAGGASGTSSSPSHCSNGRKIEKTVPVLPERTMLPK